MTASSMAWSGGIQTHAGQVGSPHGLFVYRLLIFQASTADRYVSVVGAVALELDDLVGPKASRGAPHRSSSGCRSVFLILVTRWALR